MTEPVDLPSYRVLGFQVGVGPGEVAVLLELAGATSGGTQKITVVLKPRTAEELGKQLADAAPVAAVAQTPTSLRQ
jgi:hypothetical protein